MRAPAALALALLLLAAGSRPAYAAWAEAGNIVATSALTPFGLANTGGGFSSVCSDGHGGLIVAFNKNLASVQDSLVIQRLDRGGARLWNGTTGFTVGPNDGALSAPTVLADGDGGAWVAYSQTFASAGIVIGTYARHYDANGVPSIPFPGVRAGGFSTGLTGQPRAAVTPNGELLVMWVGNGAAGATDTVRVQRVSQNGALDFGAAGLQLATSSALGNDLQAHDLLADGEGLVAIWTEETASTGPQRVRASRVSSAGAFQWGSQGVTVFQDADLDVDAADAIWDAVNGLTVAFSGFDQVESDEDLHVTRLTTAGAVNASWGSTGTAERVIDGSALGGPIRTLAIADDGAGGCVVGWVDKRNTSVVGPGGVAFRNDIRGQRYNALGNPVWTSGGVAVNASENDQRRLTLVADGAGGAYFGYLTEPGSGASGSSSDVEITHVNASGSVLWNRFHSGATAPAGDGVQDDVMLGADGGGGVLFAWGDGNDGVRANHRESDASLYTPSLAVVFPNGGESFGSLQPVAVTWTSNYGGDVRLEYTLSNGTPVLITAATPDDGAHTWYAPILDSDVVRLRVSSVDVPAAADLSNTFFDICPTVNAAATVGGPVTTPRDVESADFDEDGILDLAVATAGGLAILEGVGVAGVGNATFTGATVYATPAAANRVAIGDFNEDGILDVAVTHASGLTTFRGNGAGGIGDGTFASGVLEAGIGNCVGIVAADLDDDGSLDLAVADSVNNRVGVFMATLNVIGDGAGTFQNPVFYTVGTQPEGLAAADLDRDGDLDLVSANFGSGTVSKLTNTGASGFGSGVFTVSSTATTSGPHAVVVHDFDDDGDPDVAVAHNAGVSVHPVSLAGGVATIGAATAYVSLPQADLVVADASRDGIEDLAAASLVGAFELYFGDGAAAAGDGTFTTGGGVATTGTTPVAITAGDFNEDGRMDFVVANLATNNLTRFTGGCAATVGGAPLVTSPNGGEVWTPNTLQTITWTKGVTTTAVDVEVSRDGGANWEAIATDVGGTQFTWKAAFPASDHARVRVLAHGHPHLRDASDADFTLCSPTDSAFVHVSATGLPRDLLAADFDGDGVRDLVRLTDTGFTLARGLGAAGLGAAGFGDGSFGPDTVYTTADSARSVVAGDLDEDGIADLLVGLKTGFQTWVAQRGPGGGTGRLAADQTLVAQGYTATGAGLLDANEDGHLDALLLRQADDLLMIYRGVGDGTVNPGLLTVLPVTSPTRVVAADFNEDGILDLAFASASVAAPGVYVKAGQGAGGVANGIYGAATRLVTGGVTRDLATGDHDEDGILDLAAVTASGLSTFRGLGAGGVGNGTFAAEVVRSAFTGGACLAQSDFNQDGRMDLLVGRGGGTIFDPGVMRIHHGLGSGTAGNGAFARADQYLTLFTPLRLIPGDFRRDGVADLLLGLQANTQTVVYAGACGAGLATVGMVTPNQGEAWQTGTTHTIVWTRSATVQSVDLELSLDGGVTWLAIATNLPGTTFDWTVTGTLTQQARIRVRDAALGTVSDASDADFVIYTDPLAVAGPALPRVASFSPARPNPSRGAVLFQLALPRPARADIELFDLAGRRVRTLVAGLRPAGEHRVVWDGQDEAGVSAPAGLYLVRARTDGLEVTQRVVRIP